MTYIHYLPSQKCVSVCKLMLGDYAHQFSYTVDQLHRTIIQCTWYGTSANQHEALDRASNILNEGYSVQTFLEKDLKPYGITQSGKLWVQHKKGHDNYVFDFTTVQWRGLNYIKVSWPSPIKSGDDERLLTVSKIALVGEGNAVRKTRRWIHRQLTDGRKVFELKDLIEIQKRIHQHNTTALFIVDKGYVVDIATAKMVDRRSATRTPTETLLLERTIVDIAGACQTGNNPTPIETAFNNVYTEIEK